MSFKKKVQFSVFSAMMASSVMCSAALAQTNSSVAFDPQDPHNLANLQKYNHSALPHPLRAHVASLFSADKHWNLLNTSQLLQALLHGNTGVEAADRSAAVQAGRFKVTPQQMNAILVAKYLPLAFQADTEAFEHVNSTVLAGIEATPEAARTPEQILTAEIYQLVLDVKPKYSLPLSFMWQGLATEQDPAKAATARALTVLSQLSKDLAPKYLVNETKFTDGGSVGEVLPYAILSPSLVNPTYQDNTTEFQGLMAAINDPEATAIVNASSYPYPAMSAAVAYHASYNQAVEESKHANASEPANEADKGVVDKILGAFSNIDFVYAETIRDLKAAGPELMSLTRTPVQDLWSSLLGLQTGDAATPTKAANLFAALPFALSRDDAFKGVLASVADLQVSSNGTYVPNLKESAILDANSTLSTLKPAQLRTELSQIASELDLRMAIARYEFKKAKEGAEFFASDYLASDPAFAIAPNASFALAYTLLAPFDYSTINGTNYQNIVKAMTNETLTNGTLSRGRDVYPFPGYIFTTSYLENLPGSSGKNATLAALTALEQQVGKPYKDQLKKVAVGK